MQHSFSVRPAVVVKSTLTCMIVEQKFASREVPACVGGEESEEDGRIGHFCFFVEK